MQTVQYANFLSVLYTADLSFSVFVKIGLQCLLYSSCGSIWKAACCYSSTDDLSDSISSSFTFNQRNKLVFNTHLLQFHAFCCCLTAVGCGRRESEMIGCSCAALLLSHVRRSLYQDTFKLQCCTQNISPVGLCCNKS